MVSGSHVLGPLLHQNDGTNSLEEESSEACSAVGGTDTQICLSGLRWFAVVLFVSCCLAASIAIC